MERTARSGDSHETTQAINHMAYATFIAIAAHGRELDRERIVRAQEGGGRIGRSITRYYVIIRRSVIAISYCGVLFR